MNVAFGVSADCFCSRDSQSQLLRHANELQRERSDAAPRQVCSPYRHSVVAWFPDHTTSFDRRSPANLGLSDPRGRPAVKVLQSGQTTVPHRGGVRCLAKYHGLSRPGVRFNAWVGAGAEDAGLGINGDGRI
jgi:hypothetical protein